MPTSSLVSIIIPTFNRAHLIGETLDSVLAQTYQNWECLVVDDGSTDATAETIIAYVKQDSRIQLFKRSNTKPKGANACRNIGLENAQGDYVVFFDSDDIMTENHLDVKVSGMQLFDCDYVITKTQYFNYSNDNIDRYYQFDTFPITASNYVTQKINWLTLDVCIRATLAKSIRFNENLQSGQEYNYFCKLVYVSINARYIDEVVSLRRHHIDSIRTNLNNRHKKQIGRFQRSWFTYLDLKKVARRDALEFLLNNCIITSYESRSILVSTKAAYIKEIVCFYGFRGVYFLILLFSLKYFNLGYSFRHNFIKNETY